MVPLFFNSVVSNFYTTDKQLEYNGTPALIDLPTQTRLLARPMFPITRGGL
jgi:hypothetical protein